MQSISHSELPLQLASQSLALVQLATHFPRSKQVLVHLSTPVQSLVQRAAAAQVCSHWVAPLQWVPHTDDRPLQSVLHVSACSQWVSHWPGLQAA